jgi:cyclic pyranopterin phosphate synthase
MSESEKAEREAGLSHLDESSAARMVDVGKKETSRREARAEAWISLSASTLELAASGGLPKGDVFSTARIAGVMAAKRTHELIPMCHPLRLDSIEVDFEVDAASSRIRVVATARATDRTGVEMEALTAAAAAALTVYDMCKAVEKGIEIGPLRLLEKTGGKSGAWQKEG